MRGYALLGLFFIVFPFVFVRPYFGIYLWTLFGYLNPHRLTWGLAYDFPFSELIAVGTLIGMFFTRDRTAPPRSSLVLVWLAFIGWMCITTLFALHPDQAAPEWDRAMKIQLFSFLTIILINSKEKLRTLVWVIALSICFYGIKGGLFSLLTGGGNRVWGPPESFIFDNNALGLAILMTMPLLFYLAKTVKSRYLRYALTGGLLLSVVATLMTNSRGAFIGLVAVTLLWLINEKKKWPMIVALVVVAPALYMFMPSSWFDRMQTIETYDQDDSAMGRITAWRFAGKLATKRALGGGYGAFTEETYRQYAPDIASEVDERNGRFQNAHSIYFSVLGEQGVPGLVLFLALGALTLGKSRQVERAARRQGDDDLALLAMATRTGLVAYAVSGAFLNLAYFDLYYHLVAIVVILDRVVVLRTAERTSTAVQPPVPVTHRPTIIAERGRSR